VNILFVTINDHQYLPALFDGLFEQKNGNDDFKVLLVRPLYKNESFLAMVLKYFSTFGVIEFISFSYNTLASIILDYTSRALSGGGKYSVRGVCDKHTIPISFTDKDVNDKEVLDSIARKKVDLIISVGCPQLFKEKFISIPKKGCLNLHGSPLPRYRGVLPSFWMLKNNEKDAFNTIFFVNEVIDGGDILLQRSFPIERNDTLNSLILRSKLHASELIYDAIERVREGGYEIHAIDPKQGSYFSWPTKKDVKQFREIGRKLR
jgi:methionyl-tRNA formyltransferase